MSRGDSAGINLPESYGKGMQSVLKMAPEGARLRDKSPYYFDIGFRLVWLLEEMELLPVLASGFTRRLQYIISQTAYKGRDEVSESEFLRRLTDHEEGIYLAGCRGVESCQRWRIGELNEIKPSVISGIINK
jgi:hypothetical protein